MNNLLNNIVNYRTKSKSCPQLQINFNNYQTISETSLHIEFIQKSEIKRNGKKCPLLNQILNIINS
jgi:hypothetical protein